MDQIELIAKVCHEVNKTYCESLGDHSQVPWEEAEDWQKKSAVEGVKYRLKNPDCTSEEMHNSWMSLKKRNGWKYGTTKDVEKKTHPCMVEYSRLPHEDKVKDALFITVVQSLTSGETEEVEATTPSPDIEASDN